MIAVVTFTLLVMATLAIIGVMAGLISLGMAAIPFSRPVGPGAQRHFQGPNHSESNSTSPSREGEVIEGRVVSRH